MSDCAESMFFYGVVYESAEDFPWAKEKKYGEFDFDKWCTKNLGEEMGKLLYVGRWGNDYGDTTAWFIAVQSTFVKSDWNHPAKVTMPVDPYIGDHTRVLKNFFTQAEKFGLPWPPADRAGWHLVSFYG